MAVAGASIEPLIFLGPSATGKSSIVERLAAMGLVRVIPSWTTRPPRPSEQKDDICHVFVNERHFFELETAGRFLHVTKLFGLPYQYGVPDFRKFETGGRVPVLMLRAMMSREIATYCPASPIYQIEAPRSVATQRILQRGDSCALGTRLTGFSRGIAFRSGAG